MKIVLITLVCIILNLHAQTGDTLRVLFIGNSHTYYNNLPLLFDSLSQSAGRPVITGMSAPGGYTLEQHSNDSTTINMIAQGIWHYVVLQEQSQIPTINYWRFNSMYPAARKLDSMITAHNESTAFFMTWAWKYGGQHIINGYSSPFFVDYFHMQESVRVAYESIAIELGAKLCPVGMAWKRARTIDTLVDLWQSDYYHPTLKGSYLAACVFYSIFYRSSPVGLSYTAGLDPQDALFFQNVAWQTIAIKETDQRPPCPERQTLKIFPNPFRTKTIIILPNTLIREVSVYNIAGKCVKSFAKGDVRSTESNLTWDGKDMNNKKVPGGIYFIRLITDNRVIINKVVLTR